MSPPLRDGLKESAAAAGCSLNAYIVQVLAASAGHRARFRGTVETGPTVEEQVSDVRSLDRNSYGYPYDWKQRWRHTGARQAWVTAVEQRMDFSSVMALVRQIDAVCPWHYVEWKEFNGPELPADQESGDRRASG